MYSHFTQSILEFGVFFFWRLVQQNDEIMVEFNRKSTKFGTMMVYDIVKNIGYGPHRDPAHNSKYSRFHFLHRHDSNKWQWR